MLIESQKKKTSIEIIGFKLMHIRFVIVSSDIDLGNKDLLDTHLDLLDTNIPSKSFASQQNILKASSRCVFITSSRHFFKTFSRCLQDVFKTNKCLLGYV